MPALSDFLPWISIGLSVTLGVVVPLVIKGLRSDMRDLLDKHDAHEHAHANLKISSKLEEKIDQLTTTVSELRSDLKIALARRAQGHLE